MPSGLYDVSRMNTGQTTIERPEHRRKIRLPEVLERTGLRRSTVYEKMEEGSFPKQAKAPGTRTAMWWEDEIDDWNASPTKASSPRFKAGSPPGRQQKQVSAESEISLRVAPAHGTSRQKQILPRRPGGEMTGLERTGITFLGQEVYLHTASKKLLLDVGSLLCELPGRPGTSETKIIQ